MKAFMSLPFTDQVQGLADDDVVLGEATFAYKPKENHFFHL